jgi:hypothetical protein
MNRTIELLDGTHELKPPTFYALQLMSEYNVIFGTDDFSPSSISGMLAALLTDSEPLVDGAPAKVWTPTMAAKVMDPGGESLEAVVNVVSTLLTEAFPEPKDEPVEDRPTKARAGSK